MTLKPKTVAKFRNTMYQFYQEHGRRLPWREEHNPYRVLVSEIMLQQTQVKRVAQKYQPFLAKFPDFQALVRAPLPEILAAWQGLGYNRRALALKRTAQRVVEDFAGHLPDSCETLQTFPGIGKATAGALMAFAFNKPAVFIETNIRRVFLYFFFPDQRGVKDKEILPLVDKTLDRTRPRHWYYALMDYGVMLKKMEPNPNRRSAHYQRQAPFPNSDRQRRGLILKFLLKDPLLCPEELMKQVGDDPKRTRLIIGQMVEEGFLAWQGERLIISSG